MRNKSPISLIKGFLITGFLAVSSSCFAQTTTVFEDWNTISGTQNNFQKSIVRSKGLGGTTYYYVCGSTLNSSGNYDIFIQKKSSTGTVLWSQTYNGAGNSNDYGADVQISTTGSVYVCGSYFKNSTDSNNAIIIKYNASGTQQWAYTFNGAGSRQDIFTAMQIGTNAVVGVGTTYKGSATLYDMLVARIDTSGNQVWTQTWDYANLNDGAVNLWNNGSKIYIAGGAQSAATTYKYGVFNVKVSDGSIQGSSTTGGTAFGIDRVADIQTDHNGNIYVTGSVQNTGSQYDIKTIKFDTALTVLWSASYDGGSNLNDYGSGMTIDTAGNVLVSGCRNSSSTGRDYVVIKYSKNGTLRWSSTFDGGTNASDSATAIAVRDTNHIYVTGFSYDSVSAKNYYTIKYNGAGSMVWKIAFNTARNGSDVATAIAVDSIGGVVVAGQSDYGPGSRVYTTVRYIEYDVITPPDPAISCNGFRYEENRGQLLDDDGAPVTDQKFYCKATWPATYFSDDALSYLWTKIDTASASDDTLHRVDMVLVGSNTTRVYAMNKQETYYNYQLGQLAYAVNAVPLYSQLLYPNAYSKIDIMYTSNLKGMKHYFITRVGGNASDIEMDFQGADSVKIVNDTLMIYTQLGILKQRQATAFEIDNSGNRVALAWQPDYSINGSGNVEFVNIGSYTSGRTLVFECDWGPPPTPVSAINTLEWSTYVGTSNQDEGRDVVADATSNASWLTGITSLPPFAGQIGPTVAQYNSSIDAFVARFSSIAVSQWVSYVGGTNTDIANSIAKDGQNNTYVVGSTSSSDFVDIGPSGGIDYVWGGGNVDAFFVALDNFGAILCDSYIGSAGAEVATSIAVQKGTTAGSLDIFIVGYNQTSSSGFPFVSNGGYNQAYSSGSADGFIVQLDETYNNVWTTFFGSSQTEYFLDVAIRSPDNNPVIAGIGVDGASMDYTCGVPVSVGKFPLCDGGVGNYSLPPAGLTDNIIVEFDNTNKNLIWSTYFGGSDYEGFYAGENASIAVVNDDVYLVSDTKSQNDLPVTPSIFGNSYNQPFGSSNSGDNWFIARFSPSRQLSWCTFFGGDGNLNVPRSVCGDANYNVYVTGFTRPLYPTSAPNYCAVPPIDEHPICDYSGLNYMEVNASSTQRSFIAAFDATDNLKWSTLFAAGPNSYGYGVFATPTKLFLAGFTNGPYSLVDFNTSNALDYYVPTFQGSFSDAGISRFDISQIVSIGAETDTFSNIEVFPNPASDFVTLQLESPPGKGTTIRVVDVFGRIVISELVDPLKQTYTLDISGLSNGMYFIEVINESGTSSQKFIKNK
jgi:hypothetical protein